MGIPITLTAVLAGSFASGLPVCPLAGWWGIPCPGCGLTRATWAALHGDFAAAHALHPLVWLAVPAYASIVGSALVGVLRPSLSQRSSLSPRTQRGTTIAAAALIVALLGVWAARFAGFHGGPVEVTSYASWWSG